MQNSLTSSRLASDYGAIWGARFIKRNGSPNEHAFEELLVTVANEHAPIAAVEIEVST